MPNKNEPNKLKPVPRPGSGTGAKPKPGAVTKPGSGHGPSKGVVTPQDNDQPPQNRKVVGAATATAGALIGGFIDALIGIPRHAV
jgi:hypothetical protein